MKSFTYLLIILSLVFIVNHCYSYNGSSYEVDIESGYIIIEGAGTFPPGTTDMQEKLAKGRLAAKLDAERNLLEIMAKLNLNDEVSTKRVENQANQEVKILIEGILKDVEIIPQSEVIEDDVYYLKIRVKVKNLTPLIYSVSKKDLPLELKKHEIYTGLVIEAPSLNYLPETLQIKDLYGNLIFSVKRALYNPGKKIFKSSREEALNDPRVGDNPLIVRAVGVTNSTLVVSEHDGRLILTSLQNTDILLLTKIVVITGGL